MEPKGGLNGKVDSVEAQRAVRVVNRQTALDLLVSEKDVLIESGAECDSAFVIETTAVCFDVLF